MTNPITISSIAIRQDTEGRYSLNDLHKAAGKERRHEPKNWLNIQQTKDLIEEIINTGMSVFIPIKSKRGCKGSTYVCKELVYSYAMWISASFALKVIRAYDDLVSVRYEQLPRKTTTDQLTSLRDAVNMLVSKKHLMYSEAYAIVHQRFNVDRIEDLAAEQIPVAIEYVHKMALEGEFMAKGESKQLPLISDEYKNCRVIKTYNERGVVVSTRLVEPDEQLTTPKSAAEFMQAQFKKIGIIMVQEVNLEKIKF